MPRFGLLSLTLAAVVTTTGFAEERVPSFVDMRLNVQGTTLNYNVSDTTLSHDIAGRIGVSWTGSLGIQNWGGVIWGLGGTYGYGRDEEAVNGDDYIVRTGTIDLFVGYAYAFNESVQIEMMPIIGIGKAGLRTSSGGHDNQSYIEYGGRGNITWTFGNGFQVGLVGDILLAPDNNFSSGAVSGGNGDFDNTRIAAGAFIGVRL